MDTRGAEAVWTAITRNSSAAAAAGWEANRRNKTKPTAVDAISLSALLRSRGLSSEDHQVFTVMSSSPINWSPARNQSELRFKRRVVHEVARERHLSVCTLPGHDEPCCCAVCEIDQNLVASLQRVEPGENGRCIPAYVPHDDGRSNLTWPGAAFPPSGDAEVKPHVDAFVVIQPELHQPRVHVDCGDSQADRQCGLAVRSGRAVRRQAGVRREARCRGRCTGRRRRRVSGAGGCAAAEHEQGKQVAARRPGGQTLSFGHVTHPRGPPFRRRRSPPRPPGCRLPRSPRSPWLPARQGRTCAGTRHRTPGAR